MSVVITAFNRADFLDLTLRSLLEEQTFTDFEVIVCDDASSDHTPEVCQRYARRDARVRIIRHDETVGMPQNLNIGLSAARGEYVANLHEDDGISPKLLAKWVAALDNCAKAGFVFNQYISEGAGNAPTRLLSSASHRANSPVTQQLSLCNSGSSVLERLFFRQWRFSSPVWGTVMARRSAYEAVGMFDRRFGFLSDVDMWMRLSERGDVAYVKEPLISVTNTQRAPHQFEMSRRQHQRIARRMFLEARLRHFHGWRLGLELARHVTYVMADISVWEALRVRRFLMRFVAWRKAR